MKLQATLLTLGLLLTTSIYADGEKLFDAKCASCHTKTRPSDISTLVAPPIMGVMRHVKMNYKNKDEAVAFIVGYTLNPQKAKAVCETEKIKSFGLMPSQKGNITKEELQIIAGWIYDNFGSRGQGRGMGRGHGKCKGEGNQF